MTPPGARFASIVAMACAAAASPVQAAEPYPFAGVFSVLRADFEKHYEMTKFLCLASISVQRADGTYTAYHIDTSKLGEPSVEFHPYESGSCEYAAEKKTEHCKVLKSNWGKSASDWTDALVMRRPQISKPCGLAGGNVKLSGFGPPLEIETAENVDAAGIWR